MGHRARSPSTRTLLSYRLCMKWEARPGAAHTPPTLMRDSHHKGIVTSLAWLIPLTEVASSAEESRCILSRPTPRTSIKALSSQLAPVSASQPLLVPSHWD